MVAEVAEKRFEAKRKLDELERNAARALADARHFEEEDFRMKFEKRLEPQSAFLPSAVPKGVPPTPFDPWEFTRLAIPREFAQPQGIPTSKPAHVYPIRAFYVQHPVAA
jgi:hypothetical protein